MPEPIDPTTAGDPQDPPADPPAPPPIVSLTPEQVRATPEYQALLKQHRQLGREKQLAEGSLATLRTTAEEARQAAEAERVAALQTQLQTILGPDGQAAYDELAELSQSDPMKAALRVAELMQAAKGQTPPAAASPPAAPTTPAAGEAGTVAATSATPPPPPSSGADGSAPLGQASTGQDLDTIIGDLSKEYAGVVERNQNLATRNRVTMRDRGRGFIAYLGAAYLKAGAKPKASS